MDPRSKLIFIEVCYERTLDVKERNKKIDDIHACLYKFYNKYAGAAREQFSIGLSELTYDFVVQSDVNSIFLFCLKFFF